ncbi:MAG: DMT family transporter [Clostridia bacterium]|nr:DMT family transporter [Clostridia bacterium]
MTKKRMIGNLMLLTTAFVWGIAFVFQRSGMEHIEPLTFNSARMLLAFLVLSVVVYVTEAIQKSKNLSETKSPKELAEFKKQTTIGGILCGLMLTLGISFQQMGLVYTTAGKTGFITALYMVFVPVIGWIFLKKRITWLVGAGVALATVGMYFLSINGAFVLTKGDTLVLICAVFYALHILTCDHFVQIADVLRLSRMQFLVCAILSGIAAFIFEVPTTGMIVDAIVPILFTGFLSGGLGYTLQMIAQKHTDPTMASLILSLEAVFGVLGGWLLLNEIMTAREIIGCIVVFIAIILVQIPLPEKQKG